MNYKQTYIDYFDYSKDENILCERCGAAAVDIHHIVYKSQGGKDNIENLIALCRDCHNLAHSEKLSKSELQDVHLKAML